MRAILQHDERDCGAACLAMVAEYHGYSQSLNSYRDMTNTDQNGTSVYEIMRAAESIGLDAEALSGNPDELLESVSKEEVRCPFIAHIITDDNYSHFVVVSSINEKKVCLYDPAKGKSRESFHDFFEKWTGNIITFEKTKSFKKKKRTEKGIFSLLSLLKGQNKRFIAIIILSFFISLVGIAGAFAFQLIIDHSSEMVVTEGVHEHHEHEIEFLTDSEILNTVLENISNYFEHMSVDTVASIFKWLIFLYLIAAVVQYFRGLLIIAMTKQIDLGITLPYFNRITEMPMSAIIKRRTGDYISRYSDITAIREAVSTAVITMIIDVFMAVGCGLILGFQNVRLFMIAGIIVVIYSLVVILNRKRIKDSNRQFMERNAGVQAYIKESIDGIETIKALGATDHAKNTMNRKFRSYLDAAVRKSRIVMSQDAVVTGIETIGIAVILWFGFEMVIQGKTTLGALITFYALLGYLITPVKNLIELQPALQSGTVAYERLKDVLEMPVEETDGNDMNIPEAVSTWTVSDLCFRYGNQEQLLKNINFSFQKGERIAVVGESGCGKTTLSKLFVRLFEPEFGSIMADGNDLRKYSIMSLRNSIAYISGNTSLFSGTLYENLKMGSTEYSEEWINKICKITGVSDLISGSQTGDSFVIEEGGVNLSSGQRQRIAIARALLKKPKLIILDEATSNLDIKTETEILSSIKKEMGDVTIMMISHRISSISKFDRIIVMQEGMVVDEGTHDELKDRCELYENLANSDL